MALTGENGLLNKAGEAKEKTEKADIIERVKIDILKWYGEHDDNITEGELKTILKPYF